MDFRKPIRRWGRYALAALLLHGFLLAAIYFAWRTLTAAPPPIVVAALLSPPEPPAHAPAATPPPTTAAPAPRPPAPLSSTGARAAHPPAAPGTASAPDTKPAPPSPAGTDIDSAISPETAGSDANRMTDVIEASAAARWEAEVLAHLDRVKRYPAPALARGLEDRVSVQIRVARSGEVLFRQIIDSRGYAALDAEALALVARANPLPPPPADIRDRDLEFVVPIDFKIERTTVAPWW